MSCKGIMLAGSASGAGKTTIVCGILENLKRRGLKVAGFKCGPDYIDPMFHSKILGIDTYNLDSFLMDDDVIRNLYINHSKGHDISVIEGVMGYYDGLGMEDTGSSHSIATITGVPVVLIVNCKGMSRSVIPLVKGFVDYDTAGSIKGVIFNNMSESLYVKVAPFISELGIAPLGFLPTTKGIDFSSRHLGLVTAGEIEDFEKKVNDIADAISKTVDVDGIIKLADANDAIKEHEEIIPVALDTESDINREKNKIRIAVAYDEAFCFYYKDNIRLLEKLGCEIAYFSPLNDTNIPDDVSGIILGGGYPELHAKKLSDNKSMLASIKDATLAGVPVYAECGGFMYLHNSIKTPLGETYNMVGAIDGKCEFTDRLQHFGYVTLTANKDSMMAVKGETIKAHEFHRCVSDVITDVFDTKKPYGDNVWKSFIVKNNILAGFPHIHFYSNVNVAKRYVENCIKYKNGK